MNNKNKGFTLVELIVVLVILAILAAIMIPALLGYIDRAKGQDVLVEAKKAYMDAQVGLIDFYAQNDDCFQKYYKSRVDGYYDSDGEFHRAMCLTQSSLAGIQQNYDTKGGSAWLDGYLSDLKSKYNNNESVFSYCAHGISASILKASDSLSRKGDGYKLYGANAGRSDCRASEVTVNEYAAAMGGNADKANPVIYQIYFNEKAQIVMFEYGKNGYLVRFENGQATVNKDGKTYKSQ